MPWFYAAAFKAFCEIECGRIGENRVVSELLEYKGIAAEAHRGAISTHMLLFSCPQGNISRRQSQL